MAGRCAVETLAEFGCTGASCTQKVIFVNGTNILLCTGSDEVFLFSTQERKLKAVLRCPDPVSDLVESHDNQLLFLACRSGVYCVRSQFLLSSRTQSSQADASSSPAALQISSEFLVVPEEGVLSLLIVGSVLLTLSQRDTAWMLTLYKSSNYEMLSSFSLPLVLGVLHNDAEGKIIIKRRPMLTCVYSSDAVPQSSPSSSEGSLSDGHFHIEPVLFKLLFGIDAALTKSPVILCGLPDGRLCVLPLRLPGSRLRVLHSLEQPVVFVGAAEPGPGHARCLLVVGELGRVMLIKTDKGGLEEGGSTTGFIEGCVPGPVICGAVDKNGLYYSTGSDLLVLDLSQGSAGREGQKKDEETPRKTAVTLHTPTSLNVCRVIALAEPTCNPAGGVQLLGLSVRGQLQRITLPVGTEDSGLSEVPSTQVGRSVRDLLSAIGDVCERASVLKTAIKSKNLILKSLNQVLNISFLLTGRSHKEHFPFHEQPIRCHGVASWSSLLQKDSLNLTCVLENSSPHVLERGWTLSIAVFPLSCPPSAGGESSSKGFSFPLHDLHPGETLDVTLPLTAAGEASFPMTVSCSLIFSLTGLLGEEAAQPLSLHRSCISLPLNTLTVDWLHTLQVISLTATHRKSASQSSTVTDPIQAFLSLKSGGRAEGGGESASKLEQFSARVRVSLELLKDTLLLKSSHSDAQGPKPAPQNVDVSLLEWLLSEGPGGVKTGEDRTALSSPVVHARDPNGHTVKLTAKEVNVEEESTGTTVEVQVQSSSAAAVCGLHHAVLSRIQTLLQRAPESAASTKSVQGLGLRQALQRAEHLLQQIQQRRISGSFGVGVSTGQMTRSLLSVYQDLRENPLLII